MQGYASLRGFGREMGGPAAPPSLELKSSLAGPKGFDTARSETKEQEQFAMFMLKVTPCPRRGSHEWSSCPFAHQGETARRRDPRTHSSVACQSMKLEGKCALGDACPFAHNAWEFWLHEERYKTAICSQGTNCRRRFCFFAHHPSELRKPVQWQSPSSADLVMAAMACTPTPLTSTPSQQQLLPQLQGAPCQDLAGPAQRSMGLSPGSASAARPSSARGAASQGRGLGRVDLLALGGLGVPGLDVSPFASMNSSGPGPFGSAPAPVADAQGTSWPPPIPPLRSTRISTSGTKVDLQYSDTASATLSPPCPQSPLFSSGSGSSFELLGTPSGTCDPPSALIQVVTDELARGSLDIHQAATILGSVLPMQTLLQIAMCQQAAEAPVPAIAPPTPARAPQQELLQSGRATWSAELGWVWV